MQTTTALLLFALLTLFFSFCASATKIHHPVFDVDGKPVQVGVPYYLWGLKPNDPPLTAANRPGNTPCPQNVVKRYIHRPVSDIPVTFHPAHPSVSGHVVRVKTELNVQFYNYKVCPSNVWTIHPKGGFITTGGKLGSPSCATLPNWFQFVPANVTSHYKLVYVPRVACPPLKYPPTYLAVDEDKERRVRVDWRHDLKPVEVRFKRHYGLSSALDQAL